MEADNRRSIICRDTGDESIICRELTPVESIVCDGDITHAPYMLHADDTHVTQLVCADKHNFLPDRGEGGPKPPAASSAMYITPDDPPSSPPLSPSPTSPPPVAPDSQA